MSKEACEFQFPAHVVALAESRAGERHIEQWRAEGGLSALNQNEAADLPSPAVTAAVADALRHANRYPDHRGRLLREKLAEKLNVQQGQLILGNGSYEIIAMLLQVALSTGSEIAAPDPTYRRYLESSLLAQANYHPIPLRADGCNDPEALAAAARTANVVVVCTPNNPTGAALTRAEFRLISDAIPSDHLLVVDEAYGEFSRAEGGLDAIKELRGSSHPWVVIRTLSKAHGLAGIRFGYAIASHARIVDMVDGVRGLFNVGRVTQAAALAAIEDEQWSTKIVKRTIAERERMRTALLDAGFESMPSATNFLAVRTRRKGRDVQQGLRASGILTSLIPGRGYEDVVRISVGTAQDTDRVVAAITAAGRGD
ncbi:aminotransferase class I/II-fold pyridoxal phosphate-dependent enzyme [Boseaceae bacterium BT-24-1]|nr:aminotransferase class I/II-fold pyridoxal phosphate-dependent enzyme [Boseaceae bacterium BT-24-1]